MVEVEVPASLEGVKLLKFVKKYLKDAPLSYIYKTFRQKDVKVNGHWQKENYVLHVGDLVRIYVTDKQLEDFKKAKSALTPAPFAYPIVYEDENVLIVDKPSGLLVTEDENGNSHNLTSYVRSYLLNEGKYALSDIFSPSPAHRLDRNTAGLVCFGLSDRGLKELTDLFRERREISKKYLALVKGVPNPLEGDISAPLKKHSRQKMVYVTPISQGGLEAKTHYKVLESFNNFSLVECELLTGRTHQLRVHLSSIHHPIIGDAKYGDFALNREVEKRYKWPSSHQFLHARSISFFEVSGVLSPLKGKTFLSHLTKDEENTLFLIRREDNLE